MLGRELLAIYLAIRHFRHTIEGCASTVYTEYKPLIITFNSACDKYSPWETRHLDLSRSSLLTYAMSQVSTIQLLTLSNASTSLSNLCLPSTLPLWHPRGLKIKTYNALCKPLRCMCNLLLSKLRKEPF
ncbi:unnamed protein product, partial [Dicrocoelium dendriticum]